MAVTTQAMSDAGAVVRAGSAVTLPIFPVFFSTVDQTVTFPVALGSVFTTVS